MQKQSRTRKDLADKATALTAKKQKLKTCKQLNRAKEVQDLLDNIGKKSCQKLASGMADSFATNRIRKKLMMRCLLKL
jgi:hypothetical protein